jgi:hypothetical protein
LPATLAYSGAAASFEILAEPGVYTLAGVPAELAFRSGYDAELQDGPWVPTQVHRGLPMVQRRRESDDEDLAVLLRRR